VLERIAGPDVGRPGLDPLAVALDILAGQDRGLGVQTVLQHIELRLFLPIEVHSPWLLRPLRRLISARAAAVMVALMAVSTPGWCTLKCGLVVAT
jgi:hypothetical protein